MAVTRFTLYVHDPDEVFQWLEANGGTSVVRRQATQIVPGWNVKVAIDDAQIAESFRLRWAEDLIIFENQKKWLTERRDFNANKGSK